VVVLAGGILAAQTESGPAFEVASVKPAEITPGRRLTPLDGGPGSKTPTRLAGITTMKALLIRAYGVKSYQIRGPDWMDMALYEIDARVAPGATKEQAAAMFQTLLRERFHAEIHRETKDGSRYTLLVEKDGPKLKESDPVAAAEDEKAAAEGDLPRPKVTMGADGFPQIPADAKLPGSFSLTLSSGQFTRTKLFARHQTMDELADLISGYVNHRVLNLTGFAGKYDFTLAFESDPRFPDAADLSSAPAAPAETGPTVFAAIRQQLGLRLEAGTGPVEMLVIDHLEKVPTGN